MRILCIKNDLKHKRYDEIELSAPAVLVGLLLFFAIVLIDIFWRW